MGEARSLQHSLTFDQLQQRLRTLIDDPIAGCAVRAGAQDEDLRTVTVQVVDRLRRPWARRWAVLLWIAADAGGPPQDDQSVSFGQGDVLQTVLADGAWIVETTAAGLVEMDVEVSGPAVRHVATVVLGPVADSGPLEWS